MDYKILTQELIDYLIDLDKYFEDENIHPVVKGKKESFQLYSNDGRCFFSLDMNRMGTIEFKTTLQARYLATNDWLVRLDLNSPPHTNPDGTMTGRDHVHIIREVNGKTLNIGYNIGTVQNLIIKNTKNINKVFETFCEFCNIELKGDYQLTF